MKDYKTNLDIGIELIHSGKFSEAVNFITKSIELKNDWDISYFYRAVAMHAMEKFDDAILDYTKAIQLNEKMTDAYYNRAKIILSRKDIKKPNIEQAVKDLEKISGQTPVVTRAKKSIAGFKIREGQKIGCKVTLRGDNMYNFVNKLISISLPQVRDFRGVNPKSFDGRGNYTLGIKEQLIFSEINYDEIVKVRGMDIIFVTTAKTNEEAYDLLKGLGIPFRK